MEVSFLIIVARLQPTTLLKRVTIARLDLRKFSKIFQNRFFAEDFRQTASADKEKNETETIELLTATADKCFTNEVLKEV